MKMTISLVAMLLISILAFGQNFNQKSTEALKQRMDSVELNYWNSYSEVWEPSEYHYGYEVSGNMTLFYTDWTDLTSGEVVGEDRYEYSYNADGTIAEYFNLGWNEDSVDWENDYKEIYSYDLSGNETGSVRYRWDDTGEQWIGHDSTFNIYDSEGLLVEYSGYLWQGGQWIIRYFSTYTYEEHGWMEEHLHRMWYEDDQEWKNNIKWVYSYNDQGVMLTKTRYDQEVYEGAWVEEYRMEHIYNGENQLTTTNSAHWVTGLWEIYRTDTMSYNASGLLTEHLEYDVDEGVTRHNFIDEYSYDGNGNLTEYIHHNWDRNLLEVRPYAKHEYTYDLSYSMEDVLLPRGNSDWDYNHFPELFSDMPLSIHVYEWESDSWEDYVTMDYYYSEMNVIGVGVGQEKLASAQLYPNPVSDQLHVTLPEGSSTATLALYEISGRQVLRRQLEQGESLPVSFLPQGIYLYTLTVDGLIQSGKLVKR